MAERPRNKGASTRAVHGGERDRRESDAVATPIHQTSTFWFRDSAQLREYAEGRLVRDEYGRYSNPTWRATEHKLRELEGAEEAVLFASGMCAATTMFLALLPRGGTSSSPTTATGARGSSSPSSSPSSRSRRR